MSVDKFLLLLDIPTGRDARMSLLDSYTLSLASIAFLAGGAIICLAAVLIPLIRAREFAYALIVSVQILVLLIAASGIIQIGGH